MHSTTTSALAVALLAAGAAAQSNFILIQECNASVPLQSFTLTSCSNNYCQLVSPNGQCVSSAGAAALNPLFLAPCDPTNSSQRFAPQADGTVAQLNSGGLCWNVDGGEDEPAGTAIILYGCSNEANEVFTFLPGPARQIFANTSSLCLDASPPPPPPFVWYPIANAQLGGADAAAPASMTVAAAEAYCETLLASGGRCFGITFQGPPNVDGSVLVSFKSNTQPSPQAGWTTLLACGVSSPCPV